MEEFDYELLKEIPEMLKMALGEFASNVVTFEQLNSLINHMERTVPELVNYPIIFRSTGKESPIMMAGFDEMGYVVFGIDGELKFKCEEEYWINANFDDLQESLFKVEPDTYYLLEGTYSGEDIITE